MVVGSVDTTRLPFCEAIRASGGELHRSGLVHADVAQLEEASRSDRDQRRLDPCRQYQLDVAQWSAHRFREPGVGGSSPPAQTQCEMVEMEPCLALNQVVRVRVVLSQPSFDLLRR